MKKKYLLSLLALPVLLFSGCGGNKLDLNNYLIEERNNLFVAEDSLYSLTLSSGMREENYDFDGVVNNKIEFGILTLSRLDNLPMATDTYNYTVTIGEETYTGMLTKSSVDNSYSVDLGVAVDNSSSVNAKVDFTGYSFNQDLINVSKDFKIGKTEALSLAEKELSESINNILQDNSNIEVVMKILKDYSSTEIKNYYWYIGSISTNGDTLGVLIDASSGNIIAKKV